MPKFMELASSVDAALATSKSAEDFFDLASQPFSASIEEGLHVEALNQLLSEVSTNHLPITARHTSGRFIILHSSPFSSWAIVLHQHRSKYLYLSPLHVLQSLVGNEEILSVTRFQCEAPRDFSVLERNLTLRCSNLEVARKGEVYNRDGRCEILDWGNLSTDNQPAVTLRINSYPLESFEWAFDRTTLSPVGFSAVDGVESNLVTLLSLLAVAGNAETVSLMEPLLRNDKHFVRWGAAQAISSLDPNLAEAVVKRLADDSHPDIRSAARRAIDNDLYRLAAA